MQLSEVVQFESFLPVQSRNPEPVSADLTKREIRDQQLVLKVQSGDAEAFHTLIEPYLRMMHYVVRHMVPARTAAVVATAGGGGWGNPFDRDPELVRQDVIEGYVSIEAAARDYGVIIDPQTFEITCRPQALPRSNGSPR